MKRKIVIVAAIFWLFAALGGGICATIENYLFGQTTSIKLASIHELQTLYKAGLFDEVLRDCALLEPTHRSDDLTPYILYFQWNADSRIGHLEEADRTLGEFMSRYPSHPLATQLQYNAALADMERGDFCSAEKRLDIVIRDGAGTTLARRADDLRGRLTGAVPQRLEARLF